MSAFYQQQQQQQQQEGEKKDNRQVNSLYLTEPSGSDASLKRTVPWMDDRDVKNQKLNNMDKSKQTVKCI
jgi:hypothetical protein